MLGLKIEEEKEKQRRIAAEQNKELVKQQIDEKQVERKRQYHSHLTATMHYITLIHRKIRAVLEGEGDDRPNSEEDL